MVVAHRPSGGLGNRVRHGVTRQPGRRTCHDPGRDHVGSSGHSPSVKGRTTTGPLWPISKDARTPVFASTHTETQDTNRAGRWKRPVRVHARTRSKGSSRPGRTTSI